MSFRIDTVTQASIEGVPCWKVAFKGLNGGSEYATFYVGTDGKGLFTLEANAGGYALQAVPNSDRVCAPMNMSKDEVTTLIATWMKLQGWGTELDQWHRPIQRSLVKIVDPGDHSDDRLLEFSPELIQLMGWEVGMEFNVEVVNGALVLEPTKP